MKILRFLALSAISVAGTAFVGGCSNYDPVPVAQCGKVVAHAQKILGNMAPAYSEMMADCKKASDSERGCVLAATKKAQIAQCG